MSIADLLHMRDLGGFSLSPSGGLLVFSVRQADPTINDYRIRWFIGPTDGQSAPRALEIDGGTPITTYVGGLAYGYIPPEPAKWSPNGSQIALRRKIGDRIELLVVTPLTGATWRVADGAAQVTGFGWTPDGALVFRTGLNVAAFQEEVNAEAKHGWLLGPRMMLLAARTPAPLPPDCVTRITDPACEVKNWVATPDHLVHPATATEVVQLDQALRPAARAPNRPPAGSVRLVSEVAENGALAWSEAIDPAKAGSPGSLRRIVMKGRDVVACTAAACQGQYITALGVARQGQSVWFAKLVSSLGTEDRGPFDEVEVSEWHPSTPRPRTVLRTSDRLEECRAGGKILYCKMSSATRPAHIVAIDLDHGGVRTVVDPNPEFASKAFPKIRRITVEDPNGNRGFGYLAYPSTYDPRQKYPLVVVQYRAKGFLRGGTGDEYPILPLAAEGYFVLCVDVPADYAAERDLTLTEVERKRRIDQSGQRNIGEAIDRAVSQLVDEGLVDSSRVALTGLSFGAEVVHNSLQRTDRYAVAIVSQGAFDVTSLAQVGGTQTASSVSLWKYYLGTKSLLPGEGNIILGGAWSQQPEKLTTPLLMNIGQDEAYFGFEGFRTLQDVGRPIEVRVFPGEGHIKYYPASFAGVFENNLMWLKFWLSGVEDSRPQFREQYQRWEAMRDRVQAERIARKAAISSRQD